MSVFVPQLYRRASLPQQLQLVALVGYAVVFGALVFFPGVGISQGFYVPIVLASLAAGPAGGAAAGLIATVLYEAAQRANGLGDLSVSTGIHLLSYVAAGAIVGHFARRARGMLAEALHLLEQMLSAARHDVGAGTLTSSGLQGAITRRVAADQRFGLLVGEVAGDVRNVDDALAACRVIELHYGEAAAVARVGPAQFAVLVASESAQAVQQEASDIEQLLERHGCDATFGWASHPAEGNDALSLCRAASERLYVRGFLRGHESSAA